jgi:hypothetical protein
MLYSDIARSNEAIPAVNTEIRGSVPLQNAHHLHHWVNAWHHNVTVTLPRCAVAFAIAPCSPRPLPWPRCLHPCLRAHAFRSRCAMSRYRDAQLPFAVAFKDRDVPAASMPSSSRTGTPLRTFSPTFQPQDRCLRPMPASIPSSAPGLRLRSMPCHACSDAQLPSLAAMRSSQRRKGR